MYEDDGRAQASEADSCKSPYPSQVRGEEREVLPVLATTSAVLFLRLDGNLIPIHPASLILEGCALELHVQHGESLPHDKLGASQGVCCR